MADLPCTHLRREQNYTCHITEKRCVAVEYDEGTSFVHGDDGLYYSQSTGSTCPAYNLPGPLVIELKRARIQSQIDHLEAEQKSLEDSLGA